MSIKAGEFHQIHWEPDQWVVIDDEEEREVLYFKAASCGCEAQDVMHTIHIFTSKTAADTFVRARITDYKLLNDELTDKDNKNIVDAR